MQTDLRIHAPPDTRPAAGDFVLYWMQVTLRARDNFALNFAVEQANALRLPVLVYHGLRHDYPWANDRIHSFILESVVDLYADFAARGIQYGFWLGPGPEVEGPSALVKLAARAAVVVTDFFPTFIVSRQTEGLRRHLARAGSQPGQLVPPVFAVDSATVVPLAYHQKPYSVARAIRTRLLQALPHYLHPVGNLEPAVRRTVELPFEPTVPAADPGSIPALVAACPIDHSVPPSPLFRGGSRAAGERLQQFLRTGLPRYADDRGDPNADATSRLSPYLHFGNIGIHQVLLQARKAGPAPHYAKFEDEALVWRDLAYNFCYFDPHHRTANAIPEWARLELETHQDDPRPALYSAARLERAETGDELWNAAQRAYLRDGYMHNTLRMLWGKAVLQWTRSYRHAFRILEHLNNRYSLDGRDPNTYAGIQWIFGKFDRPFFRRPIYGTVRYQSLGAARKKFDWKRYLARYPAGPPSPGAATGNPLELF